MALTMVHKLALSLLYVTISASPLNVKNEFQVSKDLLEKYSDPKILYLIKSATKINSVKNSSTSNQNTYEQVCGREKCDVKQFYCDEVTERCTSCLDLCHPQRTYDDGVKKKCETKCLLYLVDQSQKYKSEIQEQEAFEISQSDHMNKSVINSYLTIIIVLSIIIVFLIIAIIAIMIWFKRKRKCKNNNHDTITHNSFLLSPEVENGGVSEASSQCDDANLSTATEETETHHQGEPINPVTPLPHQDTAPHDFNMQRWKRTNSQMNEDMEPSSGYNSGETRVMK